MASSSWLAGYASLLRELPLVRRAVESGVQALSFLAPGGSVLGEACFSASRLLNVAHDGLLDTGRGGRGRGRDSADSAALLLTLVAHVEMLCEKMSLYWAAGQSGVGRTRDVTVLCVEVLKMAARMHILVKRPPGVLLNGGKQGWMSTAPRARASLVEMLGEEDGDEEALEKQEMWVEGSAGLERRKTGRLKGPGIGGWRSAAHLNDHCQPVRALEHAESQRRRRQRRRRRRPLSGREGGRAASASTGAGAGAGAGAGPYAGASAGGANAKAGARVHATPAGQRTQQHGKDSKRRKRWTGGNESGRDDLEEDGEEEDDDNESADSEEEAEEIAAMGECIERAHQLMMLSEVLFIVRPTVYAFGNVLCSEDIPAAADIASAQSGAADSGAATADAAEPAQAGKPEGGATGTKTTTEAAEATPTAASEAARVLAHPAAWTPWLLSLVIEAASMCFLMESVRLLQAVRPRFGVRGKRASVAFAQIDAEIRRRRALFALYLFRSPLFSRATQPTLRAVAQVLSRIPLLGRAVAQSVRIVDYLSSFRFYTAGSS